MKKTLLIAFASTACGGASTPTTDEQTATSGSESGPALSEIAWADVPAEQRGQWMAEVIMPAMKPLFQGLDAERYAGFGCATCHGATMNDVAFHMPNGIAPLDRANIPAIFQSEEPMARLMTQEVWPKMGQLLGKTLYSEENPTGFSCMSCHGTAEGEAAEGEADAAATVD